MSIEDAETKQVVKAPGYSNRYCVGGKSLWDIYPVGRSVVCAKHRSTGIKFFFAIGVVESIMLSMSIFDIYVDIGLSRYKTVLGEFRQILDYLDSCVEITRGN